MSETTGRESELEALRQSLQKVGGELRDAEQLCARIAELTEADADNARAMLAAGRREFSSLRLELLRELDLAALEDPRAAGVRDIIAQRYVHASAINADTILRLTPRASEQLSATSTLEPEDLAAELIEAIQRWRDSKKSAAGKIGIAPKTLDRLLQGKSTKPFVQDKARTYIRKSPRGG